MMAPDSRPGLLYVVGSLNLGGTEQLVVQMSRAFRERFAVSVACLDEPGLWARELREEGIAVHCLWRQPGLDLSVAWKLARLARETGARIIHAHQASPWFYAALSRLRYPRPRLLFEEHGRLHPERLNWKRLLANRLLTIPLTQRVTAVSEDIKGRLIRFEGIPARTIRTVYNGVSPQEPIVARERERLRQELGLAPHDFVVGAVGRLDPIKNLPLLLNGVARLAPQHPQLKCLLIGDGPLAESLAEWVRDKGLTTTILLPGYRSDARRLIQCLDLFALCSFSEGTSMALLEAMAAGTPALVTRVGGNPELVVDGETGWVIASDCPSELHAALAQALRERATLPVFGQAARHRFAERFSFARMIASYQEIYEQLLKETP